MSLSIVNKVLIGTTSLATLGGLSYGAFLYLSGKSDVKEFLIKKNKRPLDLNAISGDDFEHWQELVKQHNSGKPEGKTKIAYLNLGSDNPLQALKDKCKDLLNTNKDNSDFEKNLSYAENWCTDEGAPRRISSLLSKRNKTLLTKSDTTQWKKPWTDFKAKYQDSDPIDNWKMTDWTSMKGKEDADDKFKDKCIENGNLSVMLNTQNTFVDEMERYCTK